MSTILLVTVIVHSAHPLTHALTHSLYTQSLTIHSQTHYTLTHTHNALTHSLYTLSLTIHSLTIHSLAYYTLTMHSLAYYTLTMHSLTHSLYTLSPTHYTLSRLLNTHYALIDHHTSERPRTLFPNISSPPSKSVASTPSRSSLWFRRLSSQSYTQSVSHKVSQPKTGIKHA